MNVAVLLTPKDFRDETMAKAMELMQKWDIGIFVAGYNKDECVGYHGAVYTPKILASEITTDNFDAMFIPDGAGIETFKLYDQRALLDIVRHFKEKGKVLACVNNAIKVLARANVITNTKIACVKDAETARLVQLFHGKITASPVESDGNILTSANSENTYELIDLLLDKLGAR